MALYLLHKPKIPNIACLLFYVVGTYMIEQIYLLVKYNKIQQWAWS